MKRSLTVLALALALSAAVLAAACGGSSEPKNLTKIYDTVRFFPGSTIDGFAVPPAALARGNIATFKNDRRMFVASSTVTKDQVLDYYSQELPKLGWKKEDPAKPKAQDMKNYCSAGFVTCLSFLKDNVRMIVSAPIQLQLNPQSAQGVSYHFHLEGR
jgi:hypothetical protein